LLVDCRNQKLTDGTTSLSVTVPQYSTTETISSVHTTFGNDSDYTILLRAYPDITRPAGKLGNPKHDTVHHIRTTPGPPVASRPRRLDPERLKIAKQEFDDMLQNGTARRSESPWSSPLHLVRKKNNGWRPCGDYRALNARTVPDQYPVRHIQDFAYLLAGKTVFSTIDLIKAYNQIRVYGPDIPKTSITTPFGMFEFPFMTFGLRNAAQTFQRFMDELLRGFDFAYGYLDDILISSSSEIEHGEHLNQLFKRLQDYGVLINTSKCVFGQPEVTFLGYSVSADGIRPLDSKVQAINDFPAPQTIKQLRRYLGMLNFYRRFVPGAARILVPLTALLAGDPKGSTSIDWTPALREAFNESKSCLSNATLLAHPDSKAELALQTDASDIAIGAVLQQLKRGSWEPLAFFSKKLNPAQQKYSPYDRELLAIYEAIKYFRYMVEASSFTILTDHKPLTFAFKTNRDKCSPRQFRYLDFISQFSTDIRFVPGRDNIVADTLSRIEELEVSFDYQSLAQAQSTDTELLGLLEGGSSLRLEKINIPGSSSQVFCDVSISTSSPRPYVTPSFRRRIFDSLHSLSHPGSKATVRLLTERFVWPGIRKDCRTWAKECPQCQRSKVTRHTSAPLVEFNLPSSRFRHVHIDLVGPLPLSSGFRYCLTIVDRFTRWPEAYPLQDITADSCASAFIEGWIARFGCPERITTDRGRQFESQLFNKISALVGATHLTTTAYHPAANGLVERLHRQLKAAIMCHATTQWTEVLPLVLLGIRSAWKEDLKGSPAELVYGEPLTLPSQFFSTSTPALLDPVDFASRLRSYMNKLAPQPTSWHTSSSRPFYIPKDLQYSEYVFLRQGPERRSLEAPYQGPFKVLRRSSKAYDIDVKGKSVTV
jgi:transposase InsO family protein